MGLDNLLKSLSENVNTRGNQFERISKWYFLNDPKWSMLVEEAGSRTNGLKDGDLTVGLTNIYK